MIDIASGKPGAGKSYGCSERALLELLRGTRAVVTNLPLNREECAAWLASRGCKADFLDRLYLLRDDQVREFYRLRPLRRSATGCYVEPMWLPVVGSGRTATVDFTPLAGVDRYPVLYIIDEAHLFYNSREWASLGGIMIHAASQHRHLGDDWVMITQHPKNLDSQLIRLLQRVVVYRNGSFENFLKFWRKPAVIHWEQYPGLPGQGIPLERWGSFRFDPTVGKCYETTSGVGIVGLGAPQESRAKGLPFWTIWLVPLGLLVCAYVAIVGAQNSFAYALHAHIKGSVENGQLTNKPPGIAIASAVGKKAGDLAPGYLGGRMLGAGSTLPPIRTTAMGRARPDYEAAAEVVRLPERQVTGVVVWTSGKRWTAYSDGSTETQDPRGVIVDANPPDVVVKSAIGPRTASPRPQAAGFLMQTKGR